MCTLTVVPGASLVVQGGSAIAGEPLAMRAVFSRDEKRTRAPGEPPALVEVGDRVALMPRDPDGGGSWIAATDAGLVVCVLNATAEMPARTDVDKGRQCVSRGALVPWLAECASVMEAYERLCAMESAPYAPFRLIVTDGLTRAEGRWDGAHFAAVVTPTVSPWMRTSSSLGDALVAGPRGALFEECFGGKPIALLQDAFHRHRWRDAPELSVRMSRPDARTVSLTTVEVGLTRVSMLYEEVEDGHTADCGMRNSELTPNSECGLRNQTEFHLSRRSSEFSVVSFELDTPEN